MTVTSHVTPCRFHALALLALAAVIMAAEPAYAQQRPLFTVRGFGDVGSMSFTAHDSFDAIFGESRGPIFGGGVEVVERHNLFVDFRASRFTDSGERVFRFNSELFQLGIPVDVTVTPIELTGGYRFDRGWRVVPYGGIGASWYRYKETSQFATDEENVDETFDGFHVLGGADIRASVYGGGSPSPARCSGARCRTRSLRIPTVSRASSTRTTSVGPRYA
jgi:opacity protein-like surface antigen